MKTAWAKFSFDVEIRRKGRRKTEILRATEKAAFAVPTATGQEAPVALRFRTEGRDGRLLKATATIGAVAGTDAVRIFEGRLFAPLYVDGKRNVSAEHLELSEKADTDLADAKHIPACSLVTAQDAPELPLDIEIRSNGHDESYRKISAEVARRFVEIDGILHAEADEPVLAVCATRDTDKQYKRAVEIDFLPHPRHPLAGRDVICFVRLDQRALARAVTAEAAAALGYEDVREIIRKGAPDASEDDLSEMERNFADPDVVDASALRADAGRLSLQHTLTDTLKLAHEALLKAPDEFVLAWADIRECLESLKACHPQASEMAMDSLHRLVRHGPAKDQFPNEAVRRRWEDATLPLLKARLQALDRIAAEPVRVSEQKCSPS